MMHPNSKRSHVLFAVEDFKTLAMSALDAVTNPRAKLTLEQPGTRANSLSCTHGTGPRTNQLLATS